MVKKGKNSNCSTYISQQITFKLLFRPSSNWISRRRDPLGARLRVVAPPEEAGDLVPAGGAHPVRRAAEGTLDHGVGLHHVAAPVHEGGEARGAGVAPGGGEKRKKVLSTLKIHIDC